MASRNSAKKHTSKKVGAVEAIPGRYVTELGKTTITQKNPTETAPDALSGTIIESRIEVDRNDEAQRTTESLSTALPITITDQKLTHENGGGIVSITNRLALGAQTAAGSLLITEDAVTDLNGQLTERVTGTVSGTEWPLLFGTQKLDRRSLINVDIGRQAVAAGQLGTIYTPAAINITTINTGNPGTLDLAAPHYCYPGDLITIAGVTGGTPNINGTQTVDIVAANGNSMAQRILLRGVNITVAGTGGTIINQNTQKVYVDVEPIDRWLSTKLYSRVNVGSAGLGFSAGITYPATVEFKGPTVVTLLGAGGSGFIVQGHDVGFAYKTVPGFVGQFEGYATEYRATRAQLAAWIATYHNYDFSGFLPGGEKTANPTDSFGNGRVWTFRYPQTDTLVLGTVGPSEIGRVMAVHGEILPLDLIGITIVEIVLP